MNHWYIWLPLALIFLAPFVDPSRPFRLLHLDLLVLLSFGVSQYFFNKGNVAVSVPLVYPIIGYLALDSATGRVPPARAPGAASCPTRARAGSWWGSWR